MSYHYIDPEQVDGVTKDAEKLGVRNWRARDRDDWRRLLESAMILHGL